MKDNLIKEAHELLEDAVAYMANTQPILDKQAASNEEFCNSLTKTAESLVDRGLLAESKKEEFITKSAEDHTFVLAYLDRLAKSVGAEDLGSSTNTTKRAEFADDFERLYADVPPSKDGEGQLI